MQHDIEIPQRYGIRQPIGDSVGPGGIMRALRSVPVLLDIARDVEAVAPDAWFVNVTNPLTALCRSVTRETDVKTVGLCNEWVGATCILSLLLDCGMHDIDPVLGGVNHFPLATELRVERRGRRSRSCARCWTTPSAPRPSTIWMDPPTAMKWTKVSPADALDEARRDREQPRCASRSSAASACSPARAIITRSSSCPASCTPATTTAAAGACTTTGWRATAPTPTTTSSTTKRCATRPT